MENNSQNRTLETLSFEKIDSIKISEAAEIIKNVQSNTRWADTSLHDKNSRYIIKICGTRQK